ncbi:hypothetical protein FQ087_05835 [Sporosarcina sp. ANT_H38]|uniref:hypothetical protein n=1 Tax=Sporosarcina sp. ANT_H38 TaxID=2597358 RepID=UPI0011F24467|nr:hypothetical protein [Sporosarcina sp. ANT_H38]KAA0965794.1 hypothetical protein FQ087_05835 [Sporosarcina sp. ANT_H38]
MDEYRGPARKSISRTVKMTSSSFMMTAFQDQAFEWVIEFSNQIEFDNYYLESFYTNKPFFNNRAYFRGKKGSLLISDLMGYQKLKINEQLSGVLVQPVFFKRYSTIGRFSAIRKASFLME